MHENYQEKVTFASESLYFAARMVVAPGCLKTPKGLTIFLHIPKCGGTTVHFSIFAATQYKEQGYRRFVVRDFVPPVLIGRGWTGAWPEAIRNLALIDSDTTFISGHFPFGLHEKIAGAAQYITLLRDPVAREISSYNHHYQKQFIDDSLPLERCIEQKALLDNPQTRLLAGSEFMTGICDAFTFSTALENLNTHFGLVGIVEDENTFLSAICGIYDWPPIVYPRSQISKIKAIDRPSPGLAEMIRGYHAYDCSLYEKAREMWKAWKADNVRGMETPKPEDPVIYIPPDIHDRGKMGLIRAAELSRSA